MSVFVGVREKTAPTKRRKTAGHELDSFAPRERAGVLATCFSPEAWASFTYTDSNLIANGSTLLYLCGATERAAISAELDGMLLKLFVATVPDGDSRGVFARLPIRADECICEYVGKLVQPGDARDSAYNMEIPQSGTGGFVVDARQYGNISRFMNHSSGDYNVCKFFKQVG